MPQRALQIDIKPTHHVNYKTSDGKCSRCRRTIQDEEVPLLIWLYDPNRMLIYCDDCTDKVLFKRR